MRKKCYMLSVLMAVVILVGNVNSSFAQDVDIDFIFGGEIIQAKRDSLLSVADQNGGFVFSNDKELKKVDPHAYWLMNRMMQTVQYVRTSMDGWAWMLAMNMSVEEYNERLGRSVGSPEIAMKAIEELMDGYMAGNQPEINTAYYVAMISAHYLATYEYYKLIYSFEDDYEDDGHDEDDTMQELLFVEYSAWFKMNDAVNAIMTFYTYSLARYSALPMDLNCNFEKWSNVRRKELEIEFKICHDYLEYPYISSNNVSERDFDILLDYFRSRSLDDMVKGYLSYIYEDGNYSNEE